VSPFPRQLRWFVAATCFATLCVAGAAAFLTGWPSPGALLLLGALAVFSAQRDVLLPNGISLSPALMICMAAVVVFLMLHLSNGDPAAVIAGDNATAEDIAQLRTSLGLDRPLLEQFVQWIWQLAHGDLGASIFNRVPVSTMIAQRVEPTLALTVLTMTIWDPGAGKEKLSRPVRIGTGGAPPTPALLERLAELGIDITHLYGLTETYGPSVECEWRSEWSRLPIPAQAKLKSRQGVGNVIGEDIRVVDATGADVPADGTTMGEIAIRGNNVMLGYYKDDEETRRAAPDGWFRTGDLGVMFADGYVELRDRAKDIIISGGENISSVEIEQALTTHPAVLEVAVVAASDEKWGEVPVAFVTLKEGATATDVQLIEHVRLSLARFKAPKRVIFGPLPKSATGKVQKKDLRAQLKGP